MFLISNYINNLKDKDIQTLRDNLFKLGILSKDYPEDNILLLYNKYDTRNKAPLELECRSVIIDRNNFNIICYSCPTPIYNMSALNYLIKNENTKRNIFKCYEGSLLSLFNYNDKWFLSSRRCLNSDKSVVGDVSHYNMFLDVIKQDNCNSFNDFTKFLEKKYTYHFVLIHHKNKNIVDYTKEFGEEYKKLCFIFSRNQTTHQEIDSEDIENIFVSENIFLPQKLEDVSNFDNDNKNMNFNDHPDSEGIVIKADNKLLKLQSMSYQFYKAIGPDKNLYRGFLNLYQSNKLHDYLKNNENATKYKKIINPTNLNESFDMVGTVDALFKVCTSELFELFSILWDEDGNHKNDSLYGMLPKEYKDILFNLRGRYFKFKKINKEFKLSSVYNYFKTLDCHILENFLRIRKLFFNYLRITKDDKNLNIFKQSLYKNERVYYKLSSIYTNKLFPEIMPDDLPPN